MKHLLIALFLPLAIPLQAQAPENPAPRWALHAGIFSESIGLPGFGNAFVPQQTGFRIGGERYYRNTPKKQLAQQFNLSGYQHPGYHNALVLNTGFAYRPFFGRAFIDLGAGLGYMLAHSRLPLFDNTGAGQFVERGSIRHKVSVHLNAGLGYRLGERYSLFAQYEVMAELPFGYGGNPVLPHRLIGVGVRRSF